MKIYDRKPKIKALCRRCHAPAVWYYGPISSWQSTIIGDKKTVFCDNCVHRGCSCRYDSETKLRERDMRWRRLPCIEFEYEPKGLYFSRNLSLVFGWYGRYKYPHRHDRKLQKLDRLHRMNTIWKIRTFSNRYYQEKETAEI